MKKLIILATMSLIAVTSHATVMSFNFRGTDGPFDFGAQSGEITTNGITMSFQAFGPAASTTNKLNGTASYFGIDSTVSGEDSDGIDPDEYITIAFSSSIYSSIELQEIDLGIFTSAGSDAGYYQINSGATNLFVYTGGGDVDLDPAVEILGSTLKVASTAGNGFSLNGITINAIPEPATIGMLGLGGLLTLLIRRSRRY